MTNINKQGFVVEVARPTEEWADKGPGSGAYAPRADSSIMSAWALSAVNIPSPTITVMLLIGNKTKVRGLWTRIFRLASWWEEKWKISIWETPTPHNRATLILCLSLNFNVAKWGWGGGVEENLSINVNVNVFSSLLSFLSPCSSNCIRIHSPLHLCTLVYNAVLEPESHLVWSV